MDWFKHYCNAEYSESLSAIEEKLGFEGVGRYWRFIEFLVRQFDGNSHSFRVHRSIIRSLLRHRSWNDLESFVDQLAIIRGMEIKRSGNVYEIEAPILLELQSRDFKRARTERADTAPRIDKIKSKIKIKNKMKSIGGEQTAFAHPTSFDEFVNLFSFETQNHWLDIYNQDRDWIFSELKDCYAYFYINKIKTPSASQKGWASRASGWLKRNWERHSKNSAASYQPKISNLVKSPENLQWLNSLKNNNEPDGAA